jgi:hypothetical protein
VSKSLPAIIACALLMIVVFVLWWVAPVETIDFGAPR